MGRGPASSKQLQFEAEFHCHVHLPQLLGRFTQRVWSHYVVVGLYAMKKCSCIAHSQKNGMVIAGRCPCPCELLKLSIVGVYAVCTCTVVYVCSTLIIMY